MTLSSTSLYPLIFIVLPSVKRAMLALAGRAASKVRPRRITLFIGPTTDN